MIEEVHHQHPFYPVKPPLAMGYLQVSPLHSIYYATYGNPAGIPVVAVHGGPGAGCHESLVRMFHPEKYHVVLFDQRGAIRSTPIGCTEENTPRHLIEDMEVLRQHLKLDKWLLFGGSWGSTLSLLYGQAHPDRCLGFILRGIFLGRKQDAQHLFQGMKKVFPESFEECTRCIPEEEKADLLGSFYRRVFHPDPLISKPAAEAFIKFDLICGSHHPDPDKVNQFLQNEAFVLSVSRLFLHYAVHDFFLEENQVLANMEKLQHLPALIVHGRWDAVCLPEMAYLLHKHLKNSRLWFVTHGGHSSNDPAIAASLATATDQFKEIL